MSFHSLQLSPLGEKLRYYIVREPGNVMVPLVPVDQLPFQLQDIPCQLSHREMSKGGWKFVDETKEPATLLPVLAAHQPSPFQGSSPPPATAKFLAPDHLVRRELNDVPERFSPGGMTGLGIDPALMTSAPEPKMASDPHRVPASSALDRLTSLTDSLATIYPKDAQRIGYQGLPPSGIEPDPSKKVYCTHWIRTGECDFTAVGCKYKHEIPPKDKLRELGFNTEPKWFTDKSAIKSRPLTWMQRRMNQTKEDSDSELKRPSPREFPDPSKLRSMRREESLDGRKVLKEETIRGRGILSKKEVTEHSEPLKQSLARVSELLIDIDGPAPPPSPQQSVYSANTTASSVGPASGSSLSLVSAPASPCTISAAPASHSIGNPEKKQPSIRRHSQMSWSSDDEAIKAAKQLNKRKVYPKKGAKQASLPVSIKETGLAKSKHAAADEDRTDAQSKHTKGRTNSNDTVDLQTQITDRTRQLRQGEQRREASSHRKNSTEQQRSIQTSPAPAEKPLLL